ncbi:MAG: cytidylate kinase family protein [Prevotellaceae bacterium]|nr:cytidylate kinase family protein [Prevotellaceae bacterium]
MSSIISLTGDLGSGKSTVSAILCKTLDYQYVYTGEILRRIAERYGMTAHELNVFAETHPEIDDEIDATFINLSNSSNLVVDSRLAWHFIPTSFKVFLKADMMVAAQRIFNDKERKSESYESCEEAVKKIAARKESEVKRYQKLYGVDCLDMSNYDLIVDTSNLTPQQVADAILNSL